MEKDKYLMSSVYNTLEILDLLSKHDELGVAEISQLLNFNKTSVFRMLYTLEKKEYVKKTSNAKYMLGIKFANYGYIILEKQNIFTSIIPYLQELRDRHGETTHLGILDENLNVIFMVKEASNKTIQMSSRIGLKLPFYVSAMGKVLVANNLNDEMIDRIKKLELNKSTDKTIVNCDELIEVLKKIKEQGFGIDNEESEVGLVCYGVPIKDIRGKTIAAISISGPAERMKVNKVKLINSLKETSKVVSQALGYQDN